LPFFVFQDSVDFQFIFTLLSLSTDRWIEPFLLNYKAGKTLFVLVAGKIKRTAVVLGLIY